MPSPTLAFFDQFLNWFTSTTSKSRTYVVAIGIDAIANLVRENKTFRIDSAIQTGRGFSSISSWGWLSFSRP